MPGSFQNNSTSSLHPRLVFFFKKKKKKKKAFTGLSPVPIEDLVGGGRRGAGAEEGRLKRKGIYVYI